MQSKCLTPQVVYEVEVTNSADVKLKICYGLSGTHGGLRQPILIFKKSKPELQNKTRSQFLNKTESYFRNKTEFHFRKINRISLLK